MEIRDSISEAFEYIQQRSNELRAIVDKCSDQELEDILSERFLEYGYHIAEIFQFMKMIITREDEDADHTKMTNKELKAYFEENWDFSIGLFISD